MTTATEDRTAETSGQNVPVVLWRATFADEHGGDEHYFDSEAKAKAMLGEVPGIVDRLTCVPTKTVPTFLEELRSLWGKARERKKWAADRNQLRTFAAYRALELACVEVLDCFGQDP